MEATEAVIKRNDQREESKRVPTGLKETNVRCFSISAFIRHREVPLLRLWSGKLL